MRRAMLALATFLTAAPSAPPDPPPPPERPAGDMPVIDPNAASNQACPPTSRYDAARRGGRVAAQRLNELPPADLYKTAYRRVGGCEVPIVARFGIGTRQR